MNTLKHHKVNPDVIIDVGANKGKWTATTRKIWPKAAYILVDATPYPGMMNTSNTRSIHVELLDSTAHTMPWYSISGTGDSMHQELTHHFKHVTPKMRKTTTLDAIVNLKANERVFLKIDAQGAELPILRGAKKVLQSTDFVLLEIPFFGKYNKGVADFVQHVKELQEMGFDVYDIVEKHYVKTFLVQIDVIFIRKTHPLKSRVQSTLMLG